MKISLYNSFKKEDFVIHKCIWLPVLSDSEYIISHIIKDNQRCKIDLEDVFNFPVNDWIETGFLISTFSAKKSPAIFYNKNIFIYAQSDTLANSACIVGQGLKNKDVQYLVPLDDKEKAGTFFEKKKLSYSSYSYKNLKHQRPDVLMLFNDWAKEARRIIAHCRLLSIPVICIQESIISFGDKFKRMERADFVFVQGSRTVLDLKRKQYFVTGNPRYETLVVTPIPTAKKAFINCNFTYGVHENARTIWLDGIIAVLDKQGYDYFISQHPRDTGDLKKYKNVLNSSSQEVHRQIEQSSLVITRFSSIVHEALIMGRPVIYYNPHNEKLGYDFEFNNRFLFLANTPVELEKAVTLINNNNAINTPEWSSYIVRHCLSLEKKPSQIIDELLSGYKFKSPGLSFSDFLALIFFHPLVRKIVTMFK